MDPADLGPSDSFESDAKSPISNDELLSQLAGKEIERLLAEVDDQLDAAMGILGEERPSPALVLRKYPQPKTPDQAAGLAQLFDKIDGRDQAEPDPAAEVDAEEMEMLGTPLNVFERVTGVEAQPIPAHPVDLFPEYQNEPTPTVLKPLKWINAPFEGISQAALRALGKVAIVTFVSAIALLVYVMIVIR